MALAVAGVSAAGPAQAQATTAAHCSLNGRWQATDHQGLPGGSAEFVLRASGPASCDGYLGDRLMGSTIFSLLARVRVGAGSLCPGAWSLVGTLELAAQHAVSFGGRDDGTFARAAVTMTGGAPGALTGSGSTAREGFSVAGAPMFVADAGTCDAGRLTGELTFSANGEPGSTPTDSHDSEDSTGTGGPSRSAAARHRRARRGCVNHRHAKRCARRRPR